MSIERIERDTMDIEKLLSEAQAKGLNATIMVDGRTLSISIRKPGTDKLHEISIAFNHKDIFPKGYFDEMLRSAIETIREKY